MNIRRNVDSADLKKKSFGSEETIAMKAASFGLRLQNAKGNFETMRTFGDFM